MAQGSKSRIIIWSIVGILVVVAVVMLVTKPKTGSITPPVNPERFAKVMEGRFQRFERRISAAQADFPGAPAELWQKISDEIALGRQVMSGMAGLTEQKDLEAKRDSVQKAYASARKMYKEITGKEAQEEPDGGE